MTPDRQVLVPHAMLLFYLDFYQPLFHSWYRYKKILYFCYSKGKVLWSEDAEMEVRRLFEDYRENDEGNYLYLSYVPSVFRLGGI